MSNSIKYPGKHDVMLGRGGESNYHSGNIAFRHMVQKYKERFRLGSRKERSRVIDDVVREWRDQDPVGRFVSKKKLSNGDVAWYDVGDEIAKKRAAKSLAEWSTQSPQTVTHKRKRSDDSLSSQRPGEFKRSWSPGVVCDNVFSSDLSVTLTQNVAGFGLPALSTSSSFLPANTRDLPRFPELSLPLPRALPEPQPDHGSRISENQAPAASFPVQDDVDLIDVLSNTNLPCNVSLPIERISMTIPTAAELSAVFSDDDKSSHSSGGSRGSKDSNTSKSVGQKSAIQMDFHGASYT